MTAVEMLSKSQRVEQPGVQSDLEGVYAQYAHCDQVLPDGRLAKYMPIHVKVALAGDKDSLRVLHKYGIDFNQKYNGQSALYLITHENVQPGVDATEVVEFLMDHGARFESLISALSFLSDFGNQSLSSMERAIMLEKDRRQLNDALQAVMNDHILPLHDQPELRAKVTTLLLQYGAKLHS
ncbi:MAG: hypothetical protein KGQ49_05900 [Verrucomicrobia bacterium]|nr:hypothetical protein [Verrucomicrobiota bacterium]MBU6446912.1 hypothetical protein [Verrucomicrobiota bacterium]MDE3046901.1 hypothetical protein [Verrucomicrobiota bacterium]